MTFRYVQTEFFAGLLTADDPNIELEELPDVRGQLFLWAHVVAQALKQVAEQQTRVSHLFAERIKNDERYWPAQVDDLRAMQERWVPMIVDFGSLTGVQSLALTVGQQHRVVFSLAHGWRVAVRAAGFTLSVAIPEPKNIDHAMQIARRLVGQAIDALAAFQGALPQANTPGE